MYFMSIEFGVRVCVVIVNALVVFALYAKPRERLFALLEVTQAKVYFAHHVLYETRIVVRMFSHELFVLSLQHAVYAARRTLFNHFDSIFNPEEAGVLQLHRHRTALVMRTVCTDCFRARAHRCYRHRYADEELLFVFAHFAFVRKLVAHHARLSAYRRLLFHKEWECHGAERALSLQRLANLFEHGKKLFHALVDVMFMEYLDEPRHVRALVVMRQVYKQIYISRRLLSSMHFVEHLHRIFKS